MIVSTLFLVNVSRLHFRKYFWNKISQDNTKRSYSWGAKKVPDFTKVCNLYIDNPLIVSASFINTVFQNRDFGTEIY
jgi:hypothetical protein